MTVENKSLVIPNGLTWQEQRRLFELIEQCQIVPAGNDPPGFSFNADRTQLILKLLGELAGKGASDFDVVEIDGDNGLFSVLGKRIGDGAAGGGSGLPDGYTFTGFVICVSGSPAVRYWPTWTSDPS